MNAMEAGRLPFLLGHLIVLIFAPVLALGVINRVKSVWAGRKGPGLMQVAHDLLRLLRKDPVYSDVSTWLFRLSPWVLLAATGIAALISPLVPGFSPVGFQYDFILLAYLFGVGRLMLVLGALDTGSSFEGMGASREAAFSALVEPALFLVIGSLAVVSGHASLRDLVTQGAGGAAPNLVRFLVLVSLFILLQVETARVPVDDPATHLELTMIHEVMVLDHSGPELAAVQYGAALKLVVLAGLISSILNPMPSGGSAIQSWGLGLLLMSGVIVSVALVESGFARLRMRALPLYAGTAVILSGISLGLSVCIKGGLQ
jgi:formate hydrogenlyase subunit 4